MANEEKEVFDVGDVLFSWACFFGESNSLLPRLSDSPPSSRNTSAIHNVLRWRSAIGAKSRASRRWWISSIFLLPLSLFFFFFHSFFFFKVFSLSHIDIEREREREREREGVFASMTIVNSSIDLHRWPRALIIFHGEFGFFFMCAVCFSLEESQRKIRAIKVIWTCDLFSAVKVIDWNKFPNSYWRFNYWTGSFGYVDILLIESCIDTILKF